VKISINDYALGAGVATDLVNTAPEVHAAGEALPDPESLSRFLADHAVALDAPGPSAADLRTVRALRTRTRAVLAAASEDAAVRGAAALAERAAAGPVLERDGDGGWQWYATTAARARLADELGALMGVGLLGAVRALGHGRFRACASPVCDGMFVDTSRAGRRRYCMPELCGNRIHVADHRARRRGGPGG
jgi:predicted RNA-binding Zn ribbon-like protein